MGLKCLYNRTLFSHIKIDNDANPKSLTGIVFDSVIIGCLGLLSELLTTTWPPNVDILWQASIMGLLAFFTQLAVERGLTIRKNQHNWRNNNK